MPDIQLGSVTLAGIVIPAFWVLSFFLLGGGHIQSTKSAGNARIAIAILAFGFALCVAGIVLANVISFDGSTPAAELEVKFSLAAFFLGCGIFLVGVQKFAIKLPIVGRHFLAYRLMTLRKSAMETAREIDELEKIEREYFE